MNFFAVCRFSPELFGVGQEIPSRQCDCQRFVASWLSALLIITMKMLCSEYPLGMSAAELGRLCAHGSVEVWPAQKR